MDKYNLQSNEAIIIKSEKVYHGNKTGELVLTNLNLIHIVTKGIFKTTYTARRFPIKQIKLFNGKAQVISGKNGNIDIYFVNGQESFRFWNDETLFSEKKAEKEAKQWTDNINRLLAGETDFDTADNTAIPGAEFIAETLKDTIDTFKGVFSKTAVEERITKKCTACGASISGTKGRIVCCQYCNSGQQL